MAGLKTIIALSFVRCLLGIRLPPIRQLHPADRLLLDPGNRLSTRNPLISPFWSELLPSTRGRDLCACAATERDLFAVHKPG